MKLFTPLALALFSATVRADQVLLIANTDQICLIANTSPHEITLSMWSGNGSNKVSVPISTGQFMPIVVQSFDPGTKVHVEARLVIGNYELKIDNLLICKDGIWRFGEDRLPKPNVWNVNRDLVDWGLKELKTKLETKPEKPPPRLKDRPKGPTMISQASHPARFFIR